jgi:hypothetical protein
MPHSNDNIRLQVLVNGKPSGTAGVPGCGVLTFGVTWVRRDPNAAPSDVLADPEYDQAEWICNQVDLSLGGLDSSSEEHVAWLSAPMQVGDEVTVRVLPPGEFDEPQQRYNAACPPFRTVKRRKREPGRSNTI